MPIARARLRPHLLSSTDAHTPGEVVAWFGAIQSQDFGDACWAVAQRTVACDAQDVQAAFDAGEILRTHVLRPTWHFVSPRDLRWLVSLSAPRVHQQNAPYYRRFGLDAATRKKTRGAIRRALCGEPLERRELAKRIGEEEKGARLAYVLMDAELEGLVCSGPRKGKQHTYALVDERVPPGPAIAADEALRRLTLTYFQSRGPAQVRDFSWWANLTLSEARRGIELSGLNEVVHDGRTFHVAPGPKKAVRSPSVSLLPGFDEYVIAYKDRRDLRSSAGANGAAMPALLVIDGVVAGTWQKAPLVVHPRRELTAREHAALRRAARRYGADAVVAAAADG